jgi:hypothetical protein
MGEGNIFVRICIWVRQTIGGVGFNLFLWSINSTQEQYFQYIRDSFEPPEGE